MYAGIYFLTKKTGASLSFFFMINHYVGFIPFPARGLPGPA